MIFREKLRAKSRKTNSCSSRLMRSGQQKSWQHINTTSDKKAQGSEIQHQKYILKDQIHISSTQLTLTYFSVRTIFRANPHWTTLHTHILFWMERMQTEETETFISVWLAETPVNLNKHNAGFDVSSRQTKVNDLCTAQLLVSKLLWLCSCGERRRASVVADWAQAAASEETRANRQNTSKLRKHLH